MAQYGFLVSASHNRVYSQTSAQMVKAELAVFNEAALGGRVGDIAETELGGIPYVTFTAEELAGPELRLLSNLSSLYALFEIRGDLLKPVRIEPLGLFGSDLLTIQKYSGKTNEDFTRLLVNVTAMATDSPMDLVSRKLRLLDPMCGRGTTLNQALMYGMDAAGLDIDGKDFDAYSVFIRTWLKNNRLKHQAETATVRRNRAVLGRRLHITLGATKESYKSGETLELTVVNADTVKSGDFFRPGTFDMIVTDAPYGVKHGSRPQGAREGGKGTEVLSRSPLELLEAVVPVWAGLLRSGGAVGISWNTFVARREAVGAVLEGNGLIVQDSDAHRGFEHRVDQAILRDLIVARKP